MCESQTYPTLSATDLSSEALVLNDRYFFAVVNTFKILHIAFHGRIGRGRAETGWSPEMRTGKWWATAQVMLQRILLVLWAVPKRSSI